MKYQLTITSGGGTETKSGIWEKKETKKTISFTLIDKPFWTPNCTKIRINKFYKENKPAWREIDYIGFGKRNTYMNNGHVLREWGDGTFTAYPYQSGIPYYFEPINE